MTNCMHPRHIKDADENIVLISKEFLAAAYYCLKCKDLLMYETRNYSLVKSMNDSKVLFLEEIEKAEKKIKYTSRW